MTRKKDYDQVRGILLKMMQITVAIIRRKAGWMREQSL
jgi:hypothetical protein